MNTKLDKDLLESLYKKGLSYKEIIEKTGYNKNSVNGYFYRTKGKMQDSRLYRRKSIPISQIQKEILFGTLMGDGNIQKQGIHHYLGRYNHSLKQLEYVTHMNKELQGLVSPVRFFEKDVNNKIYKFCYFSLIGNYNLREFYEMFYHNNKKKDVPFDLSLLTPRAMAYWFMDDGSRCSKCTISIATNSFSLEGLLRLQKFLKKKYNLNVTITKEFRLYFPAESGRKFYELTKDYIIDSMKYKFSFLCI